MEKELTFRPATADDLSFQQRIAQRELRNISAFAISLSAETLCAIVRIASMTKVFYMSSDRLYF